MSLNCNTDDQDSQDIASQGEEDRGMPSAKCDSIEATENSVDNLTRRLSSSVEKVDLDLSLGPLESEVGGPPLKRQRVPTATEEANKKDIHEQSTGSFFKAAMTLRTDNYESSKKYNSTNVFIKNEEEAFSKSLIQSNDTCSVHSLTQTEGIIGNHERSNLLTEENYSMSEEENGLATPRDIRNDTPGKLKEDEGLDAQNNTVEIDFDNQSAMPCFYDEDQLEVRSDISSASSLIESFLDEESRLFPPAPPSTPATEKGLYKRSPIHADTSVDALRYSVELVDREKSTYSQQYPTHTSVTSTSQTPPFMPQNDGIEDAITPRATDVIAHKAATAETPRGETAMPETSGVATEKRRGRDYIPQQKGVNLKLNRKSDFDDWDVGDRYQLKRMLGRGSYGEVAQAIDLQAVALYTKAKEQWQKEKSPQNSVAPHYRNSTFVAVKKISNAFDQEVDAVRLFREMHILRRLRGHECIIQLVDVVQPRSSDLKLFNDLYLVFEYVDTDLYKLIMSPQYLTTEHIQTFLYQMLVGLKYIHSSSVIHRDLKPAILLNEDCTLKICDFGLARIVNNEKIRPTGVMTPTRGDNIGIDTVPTPTRSEPTAVQADIDRDELKSTPRPNLSRQLTKHVVTRWYRAPELILIQPYAFAVDIWSLGCIFAELLSMQEGSVPTYQDRVPLFPGGSCYPLSGDTGTTGSDERLDQLSVIFSVIGMPTDEDLKSVGKANEYIKSLERKPGRSLESLYPAADPAAINLLKTMLMFNPAKRCSVAEALEHEFLNSVRRKSMEKSAKEPLLSPEFLDKNKIDLSILKEESYKEVLWYKQAP